MCQCGFISCSNVPLSGHVDNQGGGSACVGVGSIWEISVLSSQLCYEPKTTLEKIVFNKKIDTITALIQLGPSSVVPSRLYIHMYVYFMVTFHNE